MKFLSFILALFILGLSVMPCADERNSGEEYATVNLESQTHSHDKNSGDACSPICVCHCCNTASTGFQVQYLQEYNTIQFSKNEETEYRFSFFSHISFSIWQPPQLV